MSIRALAMPVIALAALWACSAESEHPARPNAFGTISGGDAISEPCDNDTSRACTTTLESRAGIATCYRGQETCEAGRWGECLHGRGYQMLLTPPSMAASLSPLALSTPSDCVDNPCDPRCRQYVEQPETPIQAEAGPPLYDWVTGSLGGLPGGLAKKGLNEPCATASDCQFNTYCRAPAKGTCTHSVCVPDLALVSTCNTCATEICALVPDCCSDKSTGGSWTQTCVDLVATVCGAACDDNEPSLTTAVCEPWFPGAKRTRCTLPDLAVGTPCNGNIPVCNHGTVEAPTGLRLVHFPANSLQYPRCDPDLTHPQMVSCTTKEPIPAGQCVNVTDCPGLTGNREIMVNPAVGVAGTDYISECSCEDNWSLYSGGSCIAPICAGGSSAATPIQRPVDIIFIVDNSGSMASEIASIQSRINSQFSQIIASNGVDYRLILISRYGAVSTAVGGSDHPICIGSPLGGTDCSAPTTQPLVPNAPIFYHYSADVESLNSWCLILDSYGKADEAGALGRTGWTALAPNGWSEWLRPNAFKVFIELTDDDVNCSTASDTFNDLNTVDGGIHAAAAFDRALLAMAPAQFGTEGMRNYVWNSIIAMQANSPATTPWPSGAPITTSGCGAASDGPGTGYQALSKLTGGLRYPTCDSSSYSSVLNALATRVIARANAACTYMLPADTATYDPNGVILTYTDTDDLTTKVVLKRVFSKADCAANSWYYDDPLTPTTLVLCPSTCSTISSDTTARVVVELSCPSPMLPSTTTQVYTGECDQSSSNVWFDLTYDAKVVEDGAIRFRARTAQTSSALATAAWQTLGTATKDGQSCPLGSACAIDIFATLGELGARSEFLELEIAVTPSTLGATPLLASYQLSYTCIYDE